MKVWEGDNPNSYNTLLSSVQITIKMMSTLIKLAYYGLNSTSKNPHVNQAKFG